MSKFSFDVNNDLINKTRKTINELDLEGMPSDNEELNEAMKVAKEIISLLDKHDLTYYDAYVILASLADSIYLYSTFSDKL